jgi:hypothetical protein
MCWHLTVVVPATAISQFQRLLPEIAPARPETDPEIIAAVGSDGEAFSLGIQCACDLYKKEATSSDRLRKRAARSGWSQAKLQRALKDLHDDWSGLHPAVRESLAMVAEVFGPVSLFLFWDGKGGRRDVRERREVEPATLRNGTCAVVENSLFTTTTPRKV